MPKETKVTQKCRETLKSVFGHEDYREGQEAIIEALLEGRDVLALLPTGAGKSLCFQLPALVKNGMAVVFEPLISLMKDQVDAAEKEKRGGRLLKLKHGMGGNFFHGRANTRREDQDSLCLSGAPFQSLFLPSSGGQLRFFVCL